MRFIFDDFDFAATYWLEMSPFPTLHLDAVMRDKRYIISWDIFGIFRLALKLIAAARIGAPLFTRELI